MLMKFKCGQFSRDIHASKLCNWSDHLLEELAGFRALRIDRQKSVVCVGHFTTFLSIQQKGEGDVWVHRGLHVLKKLRKLEIKTRQYDTDEAGDYGDAVPVLLKILHNSGFGYKMAAGVFTEKCRNTESKNTTNKWVRGFHFTLIMVA